MKRIVEFPLESGESILVEVDEPSSDRIGLGDDIAEKAQKTFESALNSIKPVASAIINKVRTLNDPADEVEVKFGLKMMSKLGAVIASGKGEVNCEITLKWKQSAKNVGTP